MTHARRRPLRGARGSSEDARAEGSAPRPASGGDGESDDSESGATARQDSDGAAGPVPDAVSDGDIDDAVDVSVDDAVDGAVDGDVEVDTDFDALESEEDDVAPPAAVAGADAGEVLEIDNDVERMRLDLLLCRKLPGRSRAFVQKLIEGGHAVILDAAADKELKPATAVAVGARLRVTFPPPRPTELVPEDIPIRIVYEDDDLAAIDKPAGLVMHPSSHQDQGTLVNALLYHLSGLSGIGGEFRPGIVHRLDRNTSGILIVAKNDLTHQALSNQFKEREVQKTYLAIVRGECTAREGRICLPIGRSIVNRKRMMVRTDGLGKEAVTSYRVLEEFEGYAWVEVAPRTGRTHQIRVHMSKIRLPVACDGIYGREQRITMSAIAGGPPTAGEPAVIHRHALHAHRIRFRHPRSGAAMDFSADMPGDMMALLEALRQHRAIR